MPLEIYNTLSRSKQIFEPIHTGEVGMYVCGPTVYSDSHVGHAKSYITFDVVRRYLEFLGYHVLYVQNITDVGHLVDDAEEGEDKLQERSKRERKHPMEIAEYYTQRYYEDMDALQILRPHIAPRATGHIIEQIEIISELIGKGYAYEVNGNVYFDVMKDPNYGKLSGRKTDDQEASGRVETRSDKRNPQDFALWKRAEGGHIMRWPSPWGVGFPGWHIECSAMSMKYLGETFDIHGGGLENQFPHHECEIAQSESATGKTFVRYWMHNNMVTVDGKKMGKSLGNSSYLRDLYQQYSPLTLRFTILQSHYRSTTEFKPEAIAAADTGYQKLLSAYARLGEKIGSVERRDLNEQEKQSPLVQQFIADMNDDFNTSKSLAVLYDLTKETNTTFTENRSASELETLWHIWNALAGDVLGILPVTSTASNNTDVSEQVMQLVIKWRKDARTRKDFALSDSIRNELQEIGITLEDGKEGTSWKLG